MNQPPDDPYNAPTEHVRYPSRPWPNQPPSSPNYLPQPGYPPPQGPVSQPGFTVPANYPPPQGPASQPGFPPQPGAYPQQAGGPVYPGQQPGWPSNYPGQLPQSFPPPSGYVPPQGPKKSKMGMVAIISIIVVLLLTLGSVVTVLALRAQGNTAHTNATPTTQANATSTVQSPSPTMGTTATAGITPTVTTGTPPVDTPPAGGSTPGTVGNVGQAVQAGSTWIVTITHTQTTTASDFPPTAGNTYLEITLTVKNVSATAEPISSLLEFSLADTGGGKYDESFTDTNVRQTPDGTISPGQTLNAKLAYEVPQTKHSFVLSFEYGLVEGSNASVTWQITV